jgi:hypothetical protein
MCFRKKPNRVWRNFGLSHIHIEQTIRALGDQEYEITETNTNFAGLCWGPPYPKIRFVVGNKKQKAS